MGDRYPVLDKNHQSNIKGLYVVGDIAGTPDIKAAINSGQHLAEHLAGEDRLEPIGSHGRREFKPLPHGRGSEKSDRTRQYCFAAGGAPGQADCDVLIIGGGPAGVTIAMELDRRGISYLLIERKRLFHSVAALGNSRQLYLAETGPPLVPGTLEFSDCTAGDCVSQWTDRVSSCALNARIGETVKGIVKRDLFEVRTDKGTTLARRVVVAIGKLTFLGKLDPVGEKNPHVRYLLSEPETAYSQKRILVVASAACSLAFDTACKLAADNDVTLVCEEAHDHAGEREISCACMDLAATGTITFLPGTVVEAVHGGDVDLDTRGSRKRLTFDCIFPMTRFEQKVPVDTLEAFGLKYENRWSVARLWTFIPILLAVSVFYIALKTWGWSYRWMGLYAGEFYPIVYSLIVVGFGFRAMRKYAFEYNDTSQIRRYLSMMFFQVVLFTVLPIFVIHNGGVWGLAYVWPLSVRPGNWSDWAQTKEFYLIWVLFITLVVLPIVVWLRGKSYCTWVCGCGALAETLGDRWRQYSPKGKANTAREKQIYYVTGFALVATVLVALGFDHLWDGVTISSVYSLTVDLFLIAIIPIAFYPFFGGKIWCRYWCPVVGIMGLFHKAKPKSITTLGIASRKERCIACGMCDRFCEVGVPVKSFALRGRSFDMSNTSCISCGICISVCPTRVLSFSTVVPLTVSASTGSTSRAPGASDVASATAKSL